MSGPQGAPPLLRRPVDHIGYVVDDISAAVDRWAAAGIGPFFVLPHVRFDALHRRGDPCLFDHTAAFARWGAIGVELQQLHAVEPAGLARDLRAGTGNGVNHVSYVSPEPEADSERLEAAGWPLALLCRSGPIEDRLHVAPFLGHLIEIHRASPQLAEFWAMVTRAADGWDGSEPLRVVAPPAP